MEEAAEPKEVNKIQTFVFFDLETTGVHRNKPQIVELSMIAVTRAHLLEMRDSATVTSMPSGAVKQPSSSQATSRHRTFRNSSCTNVQKKNAIPKLPRVIYKYTRPYYPRKLIHPRVEEVNGLNNEALEYLPSFTEASAQALILFLDLPKPVSLVAHNGNRFDFPLLMAELIKVGCADKFLDLRCTDSLCAIKDIDSQKEREDTTEITKVTESFSIGAHIEMEVSSQPLLTSKEWEDIEQITEVAESFSSDALMDIELTSQPLLTFKEWEDIEQITKVAESFSSDALMEMEVTSQPFLTFKEWEDIMEITKVAESFSIDDLNDKLLNEEFNHSKRQRSVESDEERGNQMTHDSNRPHESTSYTGRGNQHKMEMSAQLLLTPMKNHLPGQTFIPATPSKPAHPPPQDYTPETSRPGTPGTSGLCAKVTKESNKVCRTLTYDDNTKRKFGARLSYAQNNIYRRLFHSDYMAHRAESDSLALLTICGHYGNKFVEWADTNSTSFSNAKPMWMKRKSFSTNQEV